MTLLLIILTILCLLCNGFFAGAETAVTSANKATLRARAENGDARAGLMQKMVARMELLLGTTLVGTNLMMVSATTFTAILVTHYFGGENEALINTVLMVPLLLVIGELVPKTLGRTHADEMALRVARSLRLLFMILYPLVWFSSAAAAFISKVTGLARKPQSHVTREDIRALAELAGEEGVLPGRAVEMMQTVFELGSRTVEAVMIPLVDVAAIHETASFGDVEKIAAETGFTRFPVYRDRIDDMVGIVDVRHVLYGIGAAESDLDQQITSPIREYVQRDIVFVPETKSVEELLHELHYHKIPMAVVVDEHGGVVGIVTTEDLIEEVVGEIRDERDRDQHKVRQVAESVYECDGKLEVRDLDEKLGIKVDADGFETVAGLVLKLAGRIPHTGDCFSYQGFEIEVLKVVKHRVAKLRFRRLPPGNAPRG
jgi:putative hemolysin